MTDTRAGNRAKGRISDVGRELDIPESTTTVARSMFDRLHSELDFEGRKPDQLAAAALAVACKNESLPVTVHDIARVWNDISNDSTGDFPVKSITRRLDTVSEVTGMTYPPSDPADLVDRYAKELGVPDHVAVDANNILQGVMEHSPEILTRGTSPSGNAAAALYLAARLNDARLEFTQSDISNITDVSEVTIRNRYQEMAEALGGEEAIVTGDRYVSSDSLADRGGESNDKDEDSPVGDTSESDERTPGSSSPRSESAKSDRERSEESENDPSVSEESTIEIGLGSYLALRAEAKKREVDESEIVVDFVRDGLKLLLDGRTLEPAEFDTTIEISSSFPRRIAKLLDAEISDPLYKFDSRGDFVSAAILEGADTKILADENIEIVELPDHVFEAAQWIVDHSDEYASIAELLHEMALERVIDE